MSECLAGHSVGVQPLVWCFRIGGLSATLSPEAPTSLPVSPDDSRIASPLLPKSLRDCTSSCPGSRLEHGTIGTPWVPGSSPSQARGRAFAASSRKTSGKRSVALRIRLTLDIGVLDLLRGATRACAPWGRARKQLALEDWWSGGQGDALACLSVRTGFDLLLSELDLSPGDSIAFSAVNIADMVRVAEAHGLQPIPVELTGTDFGLNRDALVAALRRRPRVLVISHLCGARLDLDEMIRLAHEQGALVVEDCAQAWSHPQDRGHLQADASLFSFGLIKSATALGGALMRVRDPELLQRIRQRAAAMPIQSSLGYAKKCLRTLLLKLATTRWGFRTISTWARWRGKSLDAALGSASRGFPADQLLDHLRHQPCSGLLSLLRHRLQTYDTRRMDLRRAHARMIQESLQLERSQPELFAVEHCYWLFPFRTREPERLRQSLLEAGFDSARRGRLEVVARDPQCVAAQALLDETVFVPVYPELSPAEMDRISKVLSAHRNEVGVEPTKAVASEENGAPGLGKTGQLHG